MAAMVPYEERSRASRVLNVLGTAAAAGAPSLMSMAVGEARRYVRDAARDYIYGDNDPLQVGDRRTARDTRRASGARRVRDSGDRALDRPPKKAKTEPRDPDEAIERGTTMPGHVMRTTGRRMTRFHALNCVEFKQFEGTPSVSNVTNDTPVVDQLFDGMVVGSGSAQRVGRQVFLSSVRFHGVAKKPAVVQDEISDCIPHYCLGLLVLSRTHNNAASAPALVDLYDNAVTQTMGFALFRNTNNMKRLSVLRMKMFKFVPKPVLALPATTAPTGAELDQAEQQIAWSFTVKFPRALKVSFATTSTSSALSDIEDNCLLVYFLQEAAGGVTYNWTRRWRLRYTD